jgi:hypothetical protein
MELDHLVIAARTLEEGAAWLEARTGIRPQPGGKHALMSTHNLLARLGESAYLEIISIDPDAPQPARARWFNLDHLELETPRLIHWVARSTDIERDHANSLEPLGTITAVTRGAYSWRITIPDDGHLPGDGLVPTLIQWDTPNPSANLEPKGLQLLRLEGEHPNAPHINTSLETLGISWPVTPAEKPALKALLETPLGQVWL